MSVHKDLEKLVEKFDEEVRGLQANVSDLDDRVSEAVSDLETIVESLEPDSPAWNLLHKVINDLRIVTEELY
jgi:archaellum component FlaC